MESKGFRDGPVKPGPVDPLKGGFFAGEELQGLAPDIFHHLLGLRQGEAPGPDFGQGQVHQKPQVSELAVLFPNSLPLVGIIPIRQGSSPVIGEERAGFKPAPTLD
jgi:hypothetical protein